MEEGFSQILHYFPELDEIQKSRFRQLHALYSDWNSKINVISRKDIDELYIRHVLHSLAIARFIEFPDNTEILDIGTGGGFPGIPLAIFFPNCKFVLSDSIAKKLKVVHEVASALELDNVSLHSGRVELWKGKCDFVVSRAVADVSELIRWTRKFIRPGVSGGLPHGWICLKGGDLIEEASGTGMDFQIHPLNRWFEEEFFETKRILYLPLPVKGPNKKGRH